MYVAVHAVRSGRFICCTHIAMHPVTMQPKLVQVQPVYTSCSVHPAHHILNSFIMKAFEVTKSMPAQYAPLRHCLQADTF